MTADHIWKIWEQMKQERPLVHCLTNVITVNDCANILLAAGASPIMAHHVLEVEEVTQHCRSLVLNMGATEYLDAMQKAGICASEMKHPIVLDPVGVAGSTFRRNACLNLLDHIDVGCIRGNFSEIKALYCKENTGAGVDECEKDALTADKRNDSIQVVRNLAKQRNCIVIASGETDIVSNGEETYLVSNGTHLMSRVTGTGCMSSALLGAFLTTEYSVESAAACCIFMGIFGEIAEEKMQKLQGGIGTFHVQLFDAVSLIQKKELENRMRCIKK